MFPIKVTDILLLANLHSVFFCGLLLQKGSNQKGNTAYSMLLFFLSIDLTAFWILSLPTINPSFYWLLVLPALARLFFPLASPYAYTLLRNLPMPLLFFWLLTAMPMGLFYLLKLP